MRQSPVDSQTSWPRDEERDCDSERCNCDEGDKVMFEFAPTFAFRPIAASSADRLRQMPSPPIRWVREMRMNGRDGIVGRRVVVVHVVR
jgi:hypothetical protein